MLSRANRCVLFGTSARSPKAGGPEVRVWSARVKLKLKVLRLRRSESEYCQTKLRTNIKHVKFIKELRDIWAYRAQLTNEVKNKICNFKDPFTNLGIMHANMINDNYDVLANISLTLIEKMVYSGIDQDSRSLGALYVLTSLTLVSPNAADAMPWLYNSVI